MTSRRPAGDEEGFTLVEIVLASTLSLMVLLAAFGFLNTSSLAASAVARRSTNSFDARNAIDALDANLRFATGVLVCAGSIATITAANTPVPVTPVCGSPAAPATVASWSRTGAATMFVTNAAGGTQQTCDEWVISSLGLQEENGNGSTILLTIPGVMAWVPPFATAIAPNSTAQTAGFTELASGLIEVNMLVNESAKTSDSASVFDTADAVTVDDFINPDDSGSSITVANTPVPGSC